MEEAPVAGPEVDTMYQDPRIMVCSSCSCGCTRGRDPPALDQAQVTPATEELLERKKTQQQEGKLQRLQQARRFCATQRFVSDRRFEQAKLAQARRDELARLKAGCSPCLTDLPLTLRPNKLVLPRIYAHSLALIDDDGL